MELEESIKLLKEMQENCKNKTIYKDENGIKGGTRIMSEVKSELFIEEAKKSYEILFEKIMFVDKYRMLKPHWIKFHNYIKKLEKENEEYKLLNANIEKG